MLTYCFIFRAQESTEKLKQEELVLGSENHTIACVITVVIPNEVNVIFVGANEKGKRTLIFLNNKGSKTTLANVVSGKAPRPQNVKRQQARQSANEILIDTYLLYLTKLPEEVRIPQQNVFFMPKKTPETGIKDVCTLLVLNLTLQNRILGHGRMLVHLQ